MMSGMRCLIVRLKIQLSKCALTMNKRSTLILCISALLSFALVSTLKIWIASRENWALYVSIGLLAGLALVGIWVRKSNASNRK